MKERKVKAKVIKSSSKQNEKEFDTTIFGRIVDPFFNFEELLLLYYANTYHRRSINLKAKVLSSIIESDLEKFLPAGVTPSDFLYSFSVESEIYGNTFLERTLSDKLYIIPGYEARVDIDKNIYQQTFQKTIKLNGHHFKNYSPRSRFYGEPDYLATLLQIATTQKADKYNNSFLENGAKPGFAVMFENSEPTEDQIRAFREFFGENFKGYDNANKTIILSATSDMGEKPAKIRLERISQVEDISFKQLKEVNRDEIIAAHGVPPRLVGVISVGQLGGANEFISQLHAFNELEIKPKIKKIESFFKGIGVKLKLNELDTTDFKDDTDIVTALLDRNIISVGEAREILRWKK